MFEGIAGRAIFRGPRSVAAILVVVAVLEPYWRVQTVLAVLAVLAVLEGIEGMPGCIEVYWLYGRVLVCVY